MKTFEELGLIAPICKAISEIGYENPMPVQEEVIPYLLGEPMDLIALAQTGTGKTAAFGLPLLQNISVQNVKSKHPKALVLCPTRELCLQISDDLTEYSKYIPQIKILPVYGGSSIESQIKILKSGVDVIVATPGRLMDLMDRGVASLEMINTVVLDEADEMLNMGFAEAIETILSKVPIDRHMLLFSATMPKQISIIANKFLKKPKEITIGAKNIGNANINHIYYVVASKHRYLALKRIVDYYPNIIWYSILPNKSRDSRNCRMLNKRRIQCRQFARRTEPSTERQCNATFQNKKHTVVSRYRCGSKRLGCKRSYSCYTLWVARRCGELYSSFRSYCKSREKRSVNSNMSQ